MLKDSLNSLQEVAKERTVKTQDIEYDLETLIKGLKKISSSSTLNIRGVIGGRTMFLLD